jgi:23S rRNA G2069 N7-methylase RlmK/C1962 C5-methylase RlmI
MEDLPLILDGEDKSSPFKNCIRKNTQHLRKWAKRTQTNAFRLYDREMHHYPLAIDFYAGRFCVHYFAKRSESEEDHQSIVRETNETLESLFGTPANLIFWRQRIRRERTEQYEKVNHAQNFFSVLEYGLKFKVNLLDYLDTGLFLDHRETRQRVAALSKGKRVLNLFAYTCSFSVFAAAAGAFSTKSVDMSNIYTAWGRDNFILNSLTLENNEIIRADCLKFIKEEARSLRKYDLIILDPPTLSRSKKMDQLFDIQVDYLWVLSTTLKLLAPGGHLFFSTNSRRFTFDRTPFQDLYSIQDISAKTIPLDFHDPHIHRCWQITHKII